MSGKYVPSSLGGILESVSDMAIVFGPNENFRELFGDAAFNHASMLHERFKEGRLRPKQGSDSERFVNFVEASVAKWKRRDAIVLAGKSSLFSVWMTNAGESERLVYFYVATEREHAMELHTMTTWSGPTKRYFGCETLVTQIPHNQEVAMWTEMEDQLLPEVATAGEWVDWCGGVVGWIGFTSARWARELIRRETLLRWENEGGRI